MFLSLIFNSVLRSVISFPHSGFFVLGLPSSALKCTLEYTGKLYFGEAATMFLLQKKSDKHVPYRYMLSKKLQATYNGQNSRKQLDVALCKLTCETIFTIDIDQMLPKLLHRLKYSSKYLNKIQNVLTKQQGSTV